MFIKSAIKHLLLVIIFAIIANLYLINYEYSLIENESDDSQLVKEKFRLQEENFSKNVKNWQNKGSYIKYKKKYNIFYVFDEITFDNDQNQIRSIKTSIDFNSNTIVNVFLHGFPTSSYDFSKIWNQFYIINDQKLFKTQQNKIYLLTFDYLGYGLSDKPFKYDYSLFDSADLVEYLLLNLNILHINLITHDIGDSVGQEIIRRHNFNQLNFKINKLILLNGGIFYDIYQPVLSQTLLRTNYIKHVFARYILNRYFFQLGFRKIFGKLENAVTLNDLNDFYTLITYKYGNCNLPKLITYLDERYQYNEVWINALNETHVPTMFIYGPDDPINPNIEFTNKILTDLPLVKFVKLNLLVGHYPQWEDTFTVFELIKNFLFTSNNNNYSPLQ